MMYVDKFVIYVRIISFILLSNYKYPKVELYKTNFSSLADRYQEFKRQWTFTTQKPRLSKNLVTILPKLPSMPGHQIQMTHSSSASHKATFLHSQAFGYRWYIATLSGLWIQRAHNHSARSLNTKGTQLHSLPGLWVQRVHNHPARFLDRGHMPLEEFS